MSDHEKHLTEYVVLLTGMLTLVILIFMFRYDRQSLLLISAGGSIFYSFWGIIHHAIEGRLNKSIALEYLLISALVFILLYTALGF